MLTFLAILSVVVLSGVYWWLKRRSDDVIAYHGSKVSLTQVNEVHLPSRRGGR